MVKVVTSSLQSLHLLHVFPGTSFDNSSWVAVLDGVVILFSIVSLIQCGRSLLNSWHLAIVVKRFFKHKFDNFRLKLRQLVPLFNLWHVGVIISNALVIVGSVLKLLISYNVSVSLSLSLSLSFLPSLPFPSSLSPLFVPKSIMHAYRHSLSLSLHTHTSQ